jgi:hypothetical protein
MKNTDKTEKQVKFSIELQDAVKDTTATMGFKLPKSKKEKFKEICDKHSIPYTAVFVSAINSVIKQYGE